jgi:hypothetical protein
MRQKFFPIRDAAGGDGWIALQTSEKNIKYFLEEKKDRLKNFFLPVDNFFLLHYFKYVL